MKPGAGAWATTNYDPDLTVNILGLTTEDEENLMPTPKELSRDIVGCWFDDSIGSPGRNIVYRSKGQPFLETVYRDKSRDTKPLVERTEGGIQKFYRKDHESDTGDHWRINSDGDLESWDNDGLIQTAKNVPLPAKPTPPVVGAAESPLPTASETPAGTEKPSVKEPEVTPIGPLRTWRAAEGDFKVEAKLVAINAEKVTLQKLDGSTIEVPLEKLSDLVQRNARREAAKAAKIKE